MIRTTETSTPESMASVDRVLSQVEQVRQAKQLRDRTLALLAGAAVLAIGMLIAMFVDSSLNLFNPWIRAIMTVVTLAATAVCCISLLRLARQRNARMVPAARDVDATYPVLEERISTLTSCKEDFQGSDRLVHPAMLRQVSQETADINQRVEAGEVVSRRSMMTPAIALAATLLLLAIWLISDPAKTMVQLGRFWAPWSNLSVTGVDAKDGDVVAARGESLKLTAVLSGRPVESVLFYVQPVVAASETAESETKRLRPSTDDRTAVVYRRSRATDSFDYRFRAGDGQTQWHRVTVADRPRIERIALRVTPPAYTDFPKREYQKIPRKLRLIAGSTVELTVQPKQGVKSARIVMGENDWLPLEQDSSGDYTWSSELYQSVNFSVQLTELHGLKNKRPPHCNLQVVADQAPKVRILKPTRDAVVMPDETIDIHCRATDDIAVKDMSLRVYLQREGDKQPTVHEVDIPIESAKNMRKVEGAIKLDLAQFELEDGDSISYEIRATDNYRPETGDMELPDNFPMIEASEIPKVATLTPMEAEDGDASAERSANSETSPPPTNELATNQTRNSANSKNESSSSQRPSPQPSPKGRGGDDAVDAEKEMEIAERPDDANNRVNENSNPEKSLAGNTQGNSSTQTANTEADESADSEDTASEGGEQADRRTMTARADAGSDSPDQPLAENPDAAERMELADSNAASDGSPDSDMNQENQDRSQNSSGNSQSNSQPTDQQQASRSNSGSSSQSQSGSQQPPTGDSSSKIARSDSPDADNDPQDEDMASRDMDQNSPTADPVEMKKRMMDVAGQSSSSGQRQMKVDEFAGSYQSKEREKLELAIAPVLEQLVKSLTKASNHTYGVIEQAETGKPWIDRNDLALGSAAGELKTASEAVIGLNKKTRDTPYAFVGLQLESIRLSDVAPAWEQVRQSLKTQDDVRVEHVSAAWQHINRALEALNKLTEEFEVVRRENKLADKMIEFKKMHRVFIENAMATLDRAPGAINRQKREGAEFDLDEEYLKRLQEVLEMRRDMMAELARILRDDPRLLRRYMNSIGDRSRTLRDQLTLLAREQGELAMRVNLWAAAYEDREDRGGDWQGYDAVVQSQLQMDIRKLAGDLVALNDRFSSWLPLEESMEQEDVAAVIESGREAGTLLMAIDNNTHPDRQHRVMDIAMAGQRALKKMDRSLRRIGNDVGQPELVNNAVRRLTELRELRAAFDHWLGKWDRFASDKIHGVHALNQELLRDETLQYVIKITSLETQLASLLQSPGGQLPTELADKSKQILELLDVTIPGLQLTAAQSLEDADTETSTDLQTKIVTSFEEAEVLFDEVMQAIADELDKLPPQDPIAALLEDPTLDEILRQLESEQDFLEELGLTGRPSNLQIIGDWMRPGAGGGGGMSASSMLRRLMRERQLMRQMANRAYRQARLRASGKDEKPKRGMVPLEEERWNILAGQLGDGLLQGDNKVPPEKYRQAIDEYFEQISKLKNVNEN